MLSIFWFSHQDGLETSKQSRYAKKQIERILGKKIKTNIRKSAHFFIYLSLGAGLLLCREKKESKEMAQVIGFIILYAVSDEYHQSFILGREATFDDIIVDVLGGLVGLVGIKILTKIVSS